MNSAPTTSSPPMDRNWALVAAGALMGCVAVGVVFALAVLLTPMSTATGWSRAGLSSAMTLAFLSMGFAGFGWGMLSDRYGPRVVVLVGSILLGLACVLASRAGSLLQFQLTYGVLLGVAAASFFAPVMAATASSFERRRNLAISLVSAGMGMAPMTISPLVAWLVGEYDWRNTLLIVGLLAWVLTLPAVWFVRVASATATAGAGAGTVADEIAGTQQMSAARRFIAVVPAWPGACRRSPSWRCA